jgi:2',3'-cyclic-nucleotide 2'-phosphodiesterase/3'-nucleotidase
VVVLAAAGVLVNFTVVPVFFPAEKTFDIVEITDIHGVLDGPKDLPVASVLSSNIKAIRNANPGRTLVLGCGDLYEGDQELSNAFDGIPVRKVLENMGMEITALGNNEFEWDLDRINNITMKDAKCSIICANLYDKETNQRIYEPYKIFKKDGVKIAVIGSSCIKIRDRFIKYNKNSKYIYTEHVDEINALAKELRDGKKADVIIALIHDGGSVAVNGKQTGEIFKVAEKLQGVDMVLGGDTHTIVNTTVNNMPVLVGGAMADGFIHVKMTVNRKKELTFSAEYVDIATKQPNGYLNPNPMRDAEVDAIINEAKAQLKK